jgi:beta-lactamase regulating signal transducer with metallopeptidase domain
MTMQILFSDTLIHALGWTLVHSIWQGCGIALVAFILLHIHRHKSARLRYTLSSGLLFCLFLTTITTFIWLFEAKNASNTEGGVLPKTEVVDNFVYWASPNANPSFAMLWVKKAAAFCNMHLSEIAFAWLIGLLFFGLKLVFGLAHLRQWRRRGGTPLDDDFWQTRLRHLQQQLSISRPIQLMATAWTSVPMTIGWLKPIVFMPIGIINQLTVNEVEAILAHELVHIAERDYLLNVCQAFIEVIFYYHPAVWWLSAVIRTEREMRCDEMAVALCQNDAVGYAKTLVRLQEYFDEAAVPQLALAFAKKESVLSRRVKNLFQSRTKQSTIMEKITITALLVGALCALSFVKNDNKTAFLPSHTEGVASKIISDSIPPSIVEKVITRAKPEEMPKFDTIEGFKQDVYLIKKTDSEGKTDVDTLIAFSPALPDKKILKTNTLNVGDNALIETELINDGLVSDPLKYEVMITKNELIINNKPIFDKELQNKYFYKFVPTGQKGYHYMKNVSDANTLKTSKDTEGLSNTNAPVKTFKMPASTPPNAVPGHCYAYCRNEDGTPSSDWFEIPCGDKITPEFISDLIKKLKEEGLLDASINTNTMTKDVRTAFTAYQKKYNLPVGNLNMPTLKHMGIAMP